MEMIVNHVILAALVAKVLLQIAKAAMKTIIYRLVIRPVNHVTEVALLAKTLQ